MRVRGVDPGPIRLGYGVVDVGDGMRMVDCGVVGVSSEVPIERRLQLLHMELSKLIKRHQPTEVAIEEPFVGKNAKSALWVGRAEAVAILAAVSQGVPVHYYSPAQVKQQVASYGASDKHQVRQMVRIHLGLAVAPEPSDAADALAVAICHIQCAGVEEWLGQRS
jgi:crossover junction endodeoxyribonuclease RuvC